MRRCASKHVKCGSNEALHCDGSSSLRLYGQERLHILAVLHQALLSIHANKHHTLLAGRCCPKATAGVCCGRRTGPGAWAKGGGTGHSLQPYQPHSQVSGVDLDLDSLWEYVGACHALKLVADHGSLRVYLACNHKQPLHPPFVMTS